METFSIAFVCTGNRFRSPLAEAFVRHLTAGLPIETASFGTLELDGAPPLKEALEIARWCVVDLSSHRSRPVSHASLAETDLVLGFDDSHVRRAVVDADASRDRSFTIRHFARLLQTVDPPSPDDVVASARRAVEQANGLLAQDPSGQRRDAMGDPFGGPWSLHVKTAAEIRELSVLLASRLFGVSDTRVLPPVQPNRGLGAMLPWRR
jgi:protein-tyrosine phosphatase